ncbi:transcriptional adapter 2B-like isoform X2 [Macrosteles quadrilineatus]|uniref:transcriptional adapter 2B-like isoform X2 n=1 Tax=Macrosteles quadrilineatus TaxID=74068 RepID=UPI0023E0DCC2|nr:transcriptional adapter 2B-like isoform X2 [Macrosteles quadrilineatus]
MASDVFTKHSCTYCQDEIKSLRIKCTECPSFELCLQDSVGCDIFGDRSGWTAREELLLLNAIEHYSYGNWKDISQHIGTRTPEEARDEYIGRFLGGEIGRYTWVPGLRSKCKLTDLTTGLDDDPQAVQALPPTKQPVVDVRLEDAQQLDYMPLRDEFEVEYDNEAEILVSHLTHNADDDELDTALKLTQVEMYTHRLRERARRHRVVRDNQLIAQFFSNKDKPKKKISREEKELGEKLRPLCKEQEQFIMVGVLKQRRLSRRLLELMRYRRNGLVRLEEILHFDQERQLKHNTKPGNAASSIQQFSGGSKKKEKSDCLRETDTEATVERLSGGHLLSPAETQLCAALDLSPTQYISMKALMLAEGGNQLILPLVCLFRTSLASGATNQYQYQYQQHGGLQGWYSYRSLEGTHMLCLRLLDRDHII